MIQLYEWLFAWLPSPIGILFGALLGLSIVFIVLRLVKLALDALPFL